MWDAISTDDDGANVEEFQGTELRRARLGFEGSIYDWDYKFEGDFAKGDTSIKDAFVAYNTKLGGNKVNLKMGQSQIAFGFNTAASSKYMTFIDRPWYADGVLSPARQSGLVGKVSGDIWSLAASATIGELSGGTTSENADGTTFAARGTFMPLTGENTVQLGAGYMSVSQNANEFEFGQHLSNHKDKLEIESASLTGTQFDGSNAYELDAVGIFGPFHALAEYNSFTADNNTGSDIDIDSYSVEVGYFLTGESMKLKNGLWDGVSPKSSYGAWQVATRFENTDIDDNANDEKADMWTVGLNYYPTKNIRLMLDYSTVTKFESNDATKDGFEPSAIKFRAQAKW
jgi:phosphate-selective porin OprO/OprP